MNYSSSQKTNKKQKEKTKMNNTQKQKNEEGTANYTITWNEDSIFHCDPEVAVQLSELDHNVVKKTEKVYSCLKNDELHEDNGDFVEDAAEKVAYTVRSISRQYEYWSDEWCWNLAKWCHAYISITTAEERKELGVEVKITEDCKELTTEDLAPIFWEQGIDIQKEEDELLKEELLALAESGAPKPKKGTRLGDAFEKFTTEPRVSSQAQNSEVA